MFDLPYKSKEKRLKEETRLLRSEIQRLKEVNEMLVNTLNLKITTINQMREYTTRLQLSLEQFNQVSSINPGQPKCQEKLDILANHYGASEATKKRVKDEHSCRNCPEQNDRMEDLDDFGP